MKQMIFVIVTLALFESVYSASYEQSSSDKVVNALKQGGIIPGILPNSFKPKTDLKVTYVGIPMDFGTEYYPYNNETSALPTFKYTSDPGRFYTLALIDPDAPSRADPFRAQVRHWLNVNIPGTNIAAGNSTGTPYLIPRPFPGCGRKRFVYVLAEQPRNIPDLKVPEARPNFNIVNFAKQYNMKLIGANYFEVESSPGETCVIPQTSPTPTSSIKSRYQSRTRSSRTTQRPWASRTSTLSTSIVTGPWLFTRTRTRSTSTVTGPWPFTQTTEETTVTTTYITTSSCTSTTSTTTYKSTKKRFGKTKQNRITTDIEDDNAYGRDIEVDIDE